MKEIKLTQGKVAIVDDDDFDRANEFNWNAVQKGMNTKIWYAIRHVTIGKTRTTQELHRFILSAKDTKTIVDHRDRDGLNCQKINLRFCTRGQNGGNQLIRKGGESKFKGVTLYKRDGSWRAAIRMNGIAKHLGYFSLESDAAKRYDIAAKEYFGEFALLNFQ